MMTTTIIERIAVAASLVAVLGIGGGCTDQPSEKGTKEAASDPSVRAVAMVDGTPITVEAFSAAMRARSGGHPGQFGTFAQRRALLDEMIAFEAMVARARAAGYEQHPEVLEEWKRVIVGKFREEQLEAKLNAVEVDDEEIRRYYEAHIDRYAVAERARAAVIYLAIPSRAAEKSRAELNFKAQSILAAARAQPQTVRGFGALAARHSDDRASRYAGGDIGWLSKEGSASRWDSAVVEAIFSLSVPGEFGPVIETSDGLYVVKLLERKPRVVRPLAQVSEHIRRRLLVDKKRALSDQWRAEMKSKTRIDIDQAVLESVLSPGGAMAEKNESKKPPALPSG